MVAMIMEDTKSQAMRHLVLVTITNTRLHVLTQYITTTALSAEVPKLLHMKTTAILQDTLACVVYIHTFLCLWRSRNATMFVDIRLEQQAMSTATDCRHLINISA